MAFIPRTTPPKRTDKHYYSDNIFYKSGWGMPNCTAYAWGRFYEILGKKPALSTGNAGGWYSYNKRNRNYDYGNKPKLGAVMCWSRPGKAGHVGIVEKINSDGSVLTSESAYRGFNFTNRIMYPPNYNNCLGSVYHFQGFIYNPQGGELGGPLQDLTTEAEEHIGENSSWTRKQYGLNKTEPWSTAFVSAIAKQVSLLGVVIPKASSATAFLQMAVLMKMGSYHKGPRWNKKFIPQQGDIIALADSKTAKTNQFCSSGIGIVTEVKDKKAEFIYGDESLNKVVKKKFSLTSTQINGYFRPDWEKVNSGIEDSVTYEPLYDCKNTDEDATIREIGYFTSTGNMTTKSTNITLSAVNYTTLLNSVWDLVGGSLQESLSGGTQTELNIDGIKGSAKQVVSYLSQKSLPTASAIGIAANIKHESGFNTAAKGDYQHGVPTSFGICQWHLGRATNMKQMAGSNWATNLTGQLEYLWYELTSSYKSLYSELKTIPNNEAGARRAADLFVRRFEVPAYVDKQSELRQDSASALWKSISNILK